MTLELGAKHKQFSKAQATSSERVQAEQQTEPHCDTAAQTARHRNFAANRHRKIECRRTTHLKEGGCTFLQHWNQRSSRPAANRHEIMDPQGHPERIEAGA